MTLFFFVIGLEIKRELVDGELADPRKVVAPVAAAVGGAAMPVLIFLGFQSEGPGRSGWAVPITTDIAFVVDCLSLLGRRVPAGLKVFVLSLAIVEDIVAVALIAFFYTGGVSVGPLVGALVGFGVIVLLNRVGVRTVPAYFTSPNRVIGD
jgi:NhaA family Na+:H+ antiporter